MRCTGTGKIPLGHAGRFCSFLREKGDPLHARGEAAREVVKTVMDAYIDPRTARNAVYEHLSVERTLSKTGVCEGGAGGR